MPRIKGFHHSDETKKKLSLAKMGDKNPAKRLDVREKMSVSHTGLKQTKQHVVRKARAMIGKHWKLSEKSKIKMSQSAIGIHRGDKDGNWKGNDVGYRGLHIWVQNELGTPDTCEHCGKSNLKGKQIQWANKSGNYLRDITDWLRLCVPCHKKYDSQNTKTINN
jgi:hypothetical protein